MLSLCREEALQFVTEKLGIEEVERQLSKDKFRLLNEMILAFHNNIPFQTLTNMAISPGIRHIPTPDEMKDDLFSGRGGMCVALNGFFNAVLQALGYDAYITGGKMWNGNLYTHAIIIVQNIRQSKDIFLVDVGLGHPTLSAVPLDFQVESKTVVELLWWGKFMRLPAELEETECYPRFIRLRKPRNPAELGKFGFGHRELPNEWNAVYKFSLEPCSFEDLVKTVDIDIYKNVSHVLSRSLRLVQWRNGLATIVINNHLFREEEVGQCHSSILETDEDVVAAVLREFPVFDEDTVSAAVKQWRHLYGVNNGTGLSAP